MAWSKEVPQTEGRYFFRGTEADPAGRIEYGLILIGWNHGYCHGDMVRQPRLVNCSMVFWNYEGELGGEPSWAHGSRQDLAGFEFWDEPVAAPPDFPTVPGRPPDISQESIDAERKASKQADAEREAQSALEEAARLEQIEKAVADGLSLYECDDCNALWFGDDLVMGRERECPFCSTTFVEGEEGRNCPDCNRPFTRNNEERLTCPDCHGQGEMPELSVVVDGAVE